VAKNEASKESSGASAKGKRSFGKKDSRGAAKKNSRKHQDGADSDEKDSKRQRTEE